MTPKKVIIIGAGMSGISAAKRLFDLGVSDLLILEATNRIGGRIRSTYFGGLNVEMGANWIEGVGGEEVNPVWEMAEKVGLKTFCSDYSNISSNTYDQNGKRCKKMDVEKVMEESERIHQLAEEYSKTLPHSGSKDTSIYSFQRRQHSVPDGKPVAMAVDYYNYDYEFAEPPKVTSLQNTIPLPTFADYGNDVYFVADERGYEYLVYKMATEFLKTNDEGHIIDPRLQLGKVVTEIDYSDKHSATVRTDDGLTYKADFVLVSVSIGVLQSDLISFNPPLPEQCLSSIWPDEDVAEFFLFASERRGYYPVWQHFEREYPGANILMVTVTDEESTRIERQDDSETKKEAMQVLRKTFGENTPEATDILVPRWWSNKFFKGSFSNWPIGVNKHEFDCIKAPIRRLYFTGEHTSEGFNGYVHGAYKSGIESAEMINKHITEGSFEFQIKPKDSY